MDSVIFEEYVCVDTDVVCGEDITDENEQPAEKKAWEFDRRRRTEPRVLSPTSTIFDDLERLRFDARTFRDSEGAFDRINWLMN